VAGVLLVGIAALQVGGDAATPAANSEVQLPVAPLLPPLPYTLPTPASEPASKAPGAGRTRSEVRREAVSTASPTAAASTAATTRKPVTSEPATTKPVTTKPAARQPAPRQPAKAPAAGPGLRAGSAVGLELADAPGHRVRHRDFRGRSDRLGPGSPALSRADARFVVRRGLADAGCVSFESSNYPGRFLRHRNFEIRLDRAERTRLFAADATFCPVTRGRAGIIALRSVNYPDRFLTESRSRLRLTRATAGTATRYVVRSPL
jgi:hypothetical protein